MTSAGDESAPDGDEQAARLASVYLALADSELRGYCPIYERLARAMAVDDELLRQYARLRPRVGLIPILLFACVHDLVLATETTHGADPSPALSELRTVYSTGAGDPWPPFRQVLVERFDDLATKMRRRSVQTNEVGRTAAVLPALTAVHRQFDRSLALVELGPSAGLNLFLDRYGFDYGTGTIIGDRASPVRLRCELVGGHRPPLPSRPLPIVRREGIDLSPIDVTRADDRRWLEACLWPGLEYRRERLQAAIEIAGADPPLLHRGRAGDELADILRSIDGELLPCVLSTWVFGYFSDEERAAVKAVLDDVGANRPLVFITGEYPHVVDWLPDPPAAAPTDDPRGASLLGVTTWDAGDGAARPLAWMQAHGRWLNWFDPVPAA